MHETALSNEKVPVFVRKLAVFRVEPAVFRGLPFVKIQHIRKLIVRYENRKTQRLEEAATISPGQSTGAKRKYVTLGI